MDGLDLTGKLEFARVTAPIIKKALVFSETLIRIGSGIRTSEVLPHEVTDAGIGTDPDLVRRGTPVSLRLKRIGRDFEPHEGAAGGAVVRHE